MANSKTPLGRLLSTGEAQLGKMLEMVMSNPAFVARLQKAVVGSLKAKGFLDQSLRAALKAANLPSTADVKHFRQRLDELDEAMTALDQKLDVLLGADEK